MSPASALGLEPQSIRGSFFGREPELAQLPPLLESCGFVTLTGAPGIGKSHLARELASRLAGELPDGVCVVELAAVSDEARVADAVAAAASVKQVGGERTSDTLVRHLSDKRLLLVLDNCEHVVEGCAHMLEVLLRECPALSILTTSRQPIALAGETLWQLAPLPVPSGVAEDMTTDELMGYAAVRLFVERARAVEPEFALNAYVAPAVVVNCRRLDGIPLAIEFAAARVGSLTPAEIARRLDHRFELLTDRGRSDLPHHETLLAALEWSHDLLSESERALLRRLSVFSGGFDVDAAQRICCGPESAADAGELLDRLVSQSLVVADGDGGGRHRLLETIRAFAETRLERSGEEAMLRDAHAGFYLALAVEAEPELTGREQERWLHRLEPDRANLRAALEWSLSHGRGAWALRLAGALISFWRVRCHYAEGRDLLAAAVSTADGSAPELEAQVHWGLGLLTLTSGDTTRAAAPLQQSLALYRELGHRRGQAHVLLVLAHLAHDVDAPDALALAEESVALAREVGDSWCLAVALVHTGFALVVRDTAVARPRFEEAVAVARRAADQQALCIALGGLGMVAFHQSDRRTAAPALEEAVRVAGEIGDENQRSTSLMYLGALATDQVTEAELLDASIGGFRAARPHHLQLPLVARADLARRQGDRTLARTLLEEALAVARGRDDPTPALLGLGDLAVDEGDVRSARRLFEDALDRSRQTGVRPHLATALFNLAELARGDDDVKQAVLLHGEALELRRRFGGVHAVLSSIEALASLRAGNGRREHAARLYGATAALRERHDCPISDRAASRREADLRLIEQTLPGRRVEPALREGATLTLDEAAAEAATSPRKPVRAEQSGRAAEGWSALTKTEREVATLVADGLTNREIADKLFVALGTVKSHLVHVFAKLGITRRIELAAEVRRHDEVGEVSSDAPPGGASNQP